MKQEKKENGDRFTVMSKSGIELFILVYVYLHCPLLCMVCLVCTSAVTDFHKSFLQLLCKGTAKLTTCDIFILFFF